MEEEGGLWSGLEGSLDMVMSRRKSEREKEINPMKEKKPIFYFFKCFFFLRILNQYKAPQFSKNLHPVLSLNLFLSPRFV